MTHSEAYKKLKRFYHENQYDVLKIEAHLSNEETDEGRIVFDTGDGEKEVTGSATDFIMALFEMKRGVGEREDGFIDLSTTPAGNPEGYYELLEYFIDPPNEDRRQEAFERVQNGEDSLPNQIGVDEALEATLTGDIQNQELKTVVENYHEVVASRVVYMRNVDTEIRRYKQNRAHDPDRFVEYLNLAGDILKDAYFVQSPLESYRTFRETCITDIEFLLNKLHDIEDRHRDEMSSAVIDDEGRVEKSVGIPAILDQYARFYELIGDPIRDLAISLEGSPAEKLDDTAAALNYLEETGHAQLADVVKPELRNGAFHLSYELDEEANIVRIYSGKNKNRYVKEEYGIRDLVSELRFVQDIVPAIIFSFVIVNEILTVQYLRSNDFVSDIIKNSDPDDFD